MNWGALIQLTLAIAGAAAIIGGFVFYRGSTSAGARAVGAGNVAAGVAMWAILVLTVPV